MRDKERKFSLDNTLRYLYNTLWNLEGRLMAIEFKHSGKLWRADTVEEAIELRRRLELEDRVAIEAGEEPEWEAEHVWAPDTVMELLKSVGEHQKLFLRALFEHKGELTSDKVLKELSLDSEVSFAGVLSGLSKQLKKLNIKPWALYTVQVQWTAKTKTRSFKLSNDFRWAALELGWPDKWI